MPIILLLVMKFFLVILCIFVVAAAAPSQPTNKVLARGYLPALDHEEVHDEYGQYALRYVTPDGIVLSERRRLVPSIYNDGSIMVVEGKVSYVWDDGQMYVIKYSTVDGRVQYEGEEKGDIPVLSKIKDSKILPAGIVDTEY